MKQALVQTFFEVHFQNIEKYDPCHGSFQASYWLCPSSQFEQVWKHSFALLYDHETLLSLDIIIREDLYLILG